MLIEIIKQDLTILDVIKVLSALQFHITSISFACPPFAKGSNLNLKMKKIHISYSFVSQYDYEGHSKRLYSVPLVMNLPVHFFFADTCSMFHNMCIVKYQFCAYFCIIIGWQMIFWDNMFQFAKESRQKWALGGNKI